MQDNVATDHSSWPQHTASLLKLRPPELVWPGLMMHPYSGDKTLWPRFRGLYHCCSLLHQNLFWKHTQEMHQGIQHSTNYRGNQQPPPDTWLRTPVISLYTSELLIEIMTASTVRVRYSYHIRVGRSGWWALSYDFDWQSWILELQRNTHCTRVGVSPKLGDPTVER